MKLRISEEILEKTKYNLADESLDGPFNSKIDDIESGPHFENLEPPPIPPGESKVRMIPFQYRRRDPDWDVPNNKSFRKWTEEREGWIGTWDDVARLIGDILAARVIHESLDFFCKSSSPHQPDIRIREACQKTTRNGSRGRSDRSKTCLEFSDVDHGPCGKSA